MPELPDLELYVEALRPRVVGRPLQRWTLVSPFFVRTVDPDPRELEGRAVQEVRRQEKRLVFRFEDELYAVVHLMVAGRFHWREGSGAGRGRHVLAAMEFPGGVLQITEVSTRKRAAMHLFRSETGVRTLLRGGLEVLQADLSAFAAILRLENHTLKRSLTDPRLFSGIGNAYSDEILHRARLSPVKLTSRLTEEETARLYRATQEILCEWTDRLREQNGTSFPEKVTAFRPEMAVHGRYNQPCPTCGDPVQRIVYAENEANYCATCQTEGRLLADRSLSRLLKGDWPRSLQELEERMHGPTS